MMKFKTLSKEELDIIKDAQSFQDTFTQQVRQNVLEHEQQFPDMEFDKIEYGYDHETFSYKVNILFKPKQ